MLELSSMGGKDKAGIEGETVEECYLMAYSSEFAQSAFSCNSGPPVREWHGSYSGLGLSTFIISQENTHRHAYWPV